MFSQCYEIIPHTPTGLESLNVWTAWMHLEKMGDMLQTLNNSWENRPFREGEGETAVTKAPMGRVKGKILKKIRQNPDPHT